MDGQDINQVPLLGGITFMFVGDFRQTLPVVPRGSRAQIVNASLLKSRIYCPFLYGSNMTLTITGCHSF